MDTWKYRIGIFALAAVSSFCPALRAAQTTSPRQELIADGNWKFLLGDPDGAQSNSFDASGWRTVDLPHDWSIGHAPDRDNATGGGGGYFPGGVGWYRKTFNAPPDWKHKKVSIEFDGIASNATVYLNGKELGFHPYAYTSFRFDVTDRLSFSAPNVLAVRVDNSQQPSSRWYTGAGIYRHVRVVVTEPVHVAPYGVFLSTLAATSDAATIAIQADVQNESSARSEVIVRTTLYSPAGTVISKGQQKLSVDPAAHQDINRKLTIPHPDLWSPKHPALYRAVTEIRSSGKVIDRVETTFGVRTLSWSAEKGLLLNGTSIKLAGGSVHHDNGPLGAAAFDRAEERKVEILKSAGFNAVRSAHNPPSPAFLNACDRLGLLVLDEPFDVWTKPKAKFDYARYFNDWWQRDIDSMVMRDRNHPSVVLWGIGNEIPEVWTKEGAPLAKRLSGEVRALDATRPLTQAFPGATYTANADAAMSFVDVSGYNYNLAQNEAKDHERVPGRLMMSTESLPPAAFEQWKLAHDNRYIIGDFVWAAMDYLGESGAGTWSYQSTKKAEESAQFNKMLRQILANMGANGKSPFDGMAEQSSTSNPLFPGWPWHGAYTGDIDLTGFRKPQSYYRDILWNGGDRVYAAVQLPAPESQKIVAIGWTVFPSAHSWTWPGQEGRTIGVEVYSGTERVRLYLNDKLIGEMPTGVEQQRKATFAVPYAPGTLRAVGLNGDREVATDVLQTAGEPVRLILRPDRNVLHADGEDLSFITAETEDASGRMVPNVATAVHFSVTGPATIIAVGNGDMQSMETYQGDQRALFNGRALVVVRAAHSAGTVNLSASAPGLSSANTMIRIVSSRRKPQMP